MTQLLARLPHSIRTRRKISQKLKGVPKSAEHRAKIAEAMRGRKHTPQAIQNITCARRARRVNRTDEELVYEVRLRNRRKAKAAVLDRFKQRSMDMAMARRLGLPELALDVKRSWGWWVKRKTHHPRVSDGYSKRHGKVMWTPWLLKLREEGKK